MGTNEFLINGRQLNNINKTRIWYKYYKNINTQLYIEVQKSDSIIDMQKLVIENNKKQIIVKDAINMALRDDISDRDATIKENKKITDRLTKDVKRLENKNTIKSILIPITATLAFICGVLITT